MSELINSRPSSAAPMSSASSAGSSGQRSRQAGRCGSVRDKDGGAELKGRIAAATGTTRPGSTGKPAARATERFAAFTPTSLEPARRIVERDQGGGDGEGHSDRLRVDDDAQVLVSVPLEELESRRE